MELKRFFASADNYDGKNIVVDGEEFVHMTRVLRHKVGYKIIVNLDDGKDYFCTLKEINKTYAVAAVDEIRGNECRAKASATLFQALPKGDKFDLIIQKCVELGVESIVPFTSCYTNENKFNLERANRIALEACKQCGRAIKANVEDLTDFDGVLEKLADFDVVIMPYENAKSGGMHSINGLLQGKKIALIIGSEGGFSPEEVKRAEDKSAQIISLGKRILRCETASIIAIALIMYELGELQA